MPTQALPERQALVAVLLALAMLIVVVELVRKRKLREEYSFLWVGTALALLVLAVWSDSLTWFQQLIGAAVPTSALFFGGLVFLMLVALQFSVRISKESFRQKTMAQRTALLEREVDELRARIDELEAERKGRAAPPRREAGSAS